MKPKTTLASLILVAFAVALGSCEYKVPLSAKQNIKIDSKVLGHWEQVEANDQGKKHSLIVLKYENGEYLVHYPTGDDGLYFRAYPIKVGGISCVQIQVIGTAKGVIKEEDRGYLVLHYTQNGDTMVVKVINSKVVSPKVKTTGELKKAFLSNKDHKELWKEPQVFRKLSNES